MSFAALRYVGRFAPSPTGPLHAGSLVAALASWLDARAWNAGHGGRWLVRIEDLDTTRCVDGAAQTILQQLQDCHLVPDEAPVYQTRRRDRYARALTQLMDLGRAYPCGCSRKDIEAALQARGTARPRHGERVYPGTCRDGLHGKKALSWRFRVAPAGPAPAGSDGGAQAHTARHPEIHQAWVRWTDRRLGAQQQDVATEVGDFVLQRADGPFAYQLAVVVDDAEQHISDVVRGADLVDNTARQILLQQALALPTPRYLHTPLVLGHDGHKLSKQNGAQAIDTRAPLQALASAAASLGLPAHPGPIPDALAAWVAAWRHLYNPGQ
jgi:glutamyl-Q tRNA(Asp) synthetase